MGQRMDNNLVSLVFAVIFMHNMIYPTEEQAVSMQRRGNGNPSNSIATKKTVEEILHVQVQSRLSNYSRLEGVNRINAGYCNGSPFNGNQKSCCFDRYLVSLRIPWEICCASSVTGKIDGRTELCCASGPMTKARASQKCCYDTLIDTDHQGCCYNAALNTSASFNLSTSFCCGGNVVPKTTRCCGGRWVLQEGEVCCPRGGPRRVSNSQQRCCDGDYGRQIYNSRTQTCVNGIVASRSSCGGPGRLCCQGVEHEARGGEVRCCLPGTNSYFKRNQTCCFGRVYNGSNLACCGENLCSQTTTCPASFNRSCGSGCLTNGQNICCGGQVTSFQMGPNRRRCCGRLTYSGSTQRCLNGQVREFPMCREQRCGGMLKGGIGCRRVNNSILVLEGIAKKSKGRSAVTFQSVAQLAKCGRSPHRKTIYPKQIDYKTPKKCKCSLKNGIRYMIIVRNYQRNEMQNQTYRLAKQDLVLKYSLENLVRIKQTIRYHGTTYANACKFDI